MGHTESAANADAIRRQLQRILASRVFFPAQRSQAFLRYVVEKSLLGLVPKEYEIAVDVFERSADYDPTVDATVRVEASRLRTRLREYYDTQGKHDPVLIEIPKGGYAPLFTQIATEPDSDPADSLTPAAERETNGHTPPAAQRNGSGSAPARQPAPVDTAPAASSEAPRKLRSRRALIWASLLVAFSFSAAFSIWSFMQWERTHVSIRSLAVLPLQNLSGDPSQNYLAAGITDELTTMLEKDSTLRVVPRTLAMQYRGTREPSRKIAQALGVDGILEGSVQRSGERVQLTLRLIQENVQGPGGTPVWTQSYERNAEETASLSDDAATAIAKKTNSAVAAQKPQRYVNPAAHDAYMHGRYLWVAGRNDEAEQYFIRAVALQPDYALAWTGVADYYGQAMLLGQMNPHEGLQPFQSAAERAVQLDGTLAQTHLPLCAAILYAQWDPAGADKECRRAIELDPEYAEAYHLHAKVLIFLNRNQEAIASQKKAMELDPFARPWALAYIYVLARQYDAAITEAKQRLESTPNDAETFAILSTAYRRKGMYAEAMQTEEESLVARGDAADAEKVRREFASGGYGTVVRGYLAVLETRAKTHYVSPVDLALQYAQLGKREKTLSLLEEAYRQHSPQMVEMVQNDPAFDFLHKDARYRALIQKTGLPPKY